MKLVLESKYVFEYVDGYFVDEYNKMGLKYFV